MLDWESLAPRKKSDSSLSAGAGEVDEDDDRESSCSSAVAGLCREAGPAAAAAILSVLREERFRWKRKHDQRGAFRVAFSVFGQDSGGVQGSQG